MKRTMKKLLSVLAAVVVVAASGCTSVPVAPEGSDDAKAVASFKPVPDRGVIYIYWDKDSQYGLYAIPVSVGDAGKVDTFINGYARVEVAPGTYTVEPHTYEMTASVKPATVTIKSGEVRFVRMKLAARLMLGAKGSVVEVPANEAIKEIRARKLTPGKLARF